MSNFNIYSIGGINYGNYLPQITTALQLMPDGLLYLDDMRLSEIPVLPSTVKILSCRKNYLREIPTLPSSLEQLYCDKNHYLSYIGPLPKTLQTLTCDYTGLTTLPELPEGLKRLSVNYSNLKTLPHLPESLQSFSCLNNPLIEPYKTFVMRYSDNYHYIEYGLKELKRDVNEYNSKSRQQMRASILKPNIVAARFDPAKIQKNLNRNQVNMEGYMTEENWEKYFTRRGEVWAEGVGTGAVGGKRSGRKTKRRKSSKKKTQKRR
jgi:Leucine-rich repeat (LRR) protein